MKKFAASLTSAFTLTACAFALTASPAAALPACSYNAIGETFSVALDTSPESAKVTFRRSGSEIQALDANGAVIGEPPTYPVCTGAPPATITNTGTIELFDPDAGHDATVIIDEQNGSFAPGSNTPPDTGSAEIFFNLSFGGAGGGAGDRLELNTTDNADNVLVGESPAGIAGANLNHGESVKDIDVTAEGVEIVDVNTRKGDDAISAIGDAAVGGLENPLTIGDLTLQGGNQNDTIRGGAGNDKLFGGTQDDDLDGGGGADTVNGGPDNDALDGGAQADSIIGDTGTDFATYATAPGPVSVTLDGLANDGGAPDGSADNVQLDVENVKGGNGNDFLIGSALPNELTGNGGNDTVNGGLGNDKVSGSGGIDRLLGGLGNDRIFGGTENDNMVGAAGNDVITGNAGKDIFIGKKGNDRLIARDGARDKKIDCGPGSRKKESVTRDRRDPKAKSC